MKTKLYASKLKYQRKLCITDKKIKKNFEGNRKLLPANNQVNLYTLKASECLLRRTVEKHNKVVCHWWLYNLPCYFAGCSLCDVLQKSASTTQSSVACSRRDRLVCVSGGDARYDTGCFTQLIATFMAFFHNCDS